MTGHPWTALYLGVWLIFGLTGLLMAPLHRHERNRP